MNKSMKLTAFAFALMLASATNSHAISVDIQSATDSCTVNVSGIVNYTSKLPATAVTIEFLPPNGGTAVPLIINLPLQTGGAFKWSSSVPGYQSFPSGSSVLVVTNRQISSSAPLQTCTIQ